MSVSTANRAKSAKTGDSVAERIRSIQPKEADAPGRHLGGANLLDGICEASEARFLDSDREDEGKRAANSCRRVFGPLS